MSMPSDALTPMPVPSSLGFKFDTTGSATPSNIDAKTGQPKRGRGRPSGAKNIPKEPSGGVNPSSRMNIPTGSNNQNPPRGSDPVDTAEATKARKKVKAEQYSQFINEELNDKLFMLIIGATKMPAEAIYKNGKVPPKIQGNPNLTEFGNAISIPADVADSWGKLLAELSDTNAGKTLAKTAGSANTGIAFAAIAAIFSTYRYVQQIKPILDHLKSMQQTSEVPNAE